MLEHGPWRIEADGVMHLQAGTFRLVVQKVNEAIRFVVLRDPDRSEAYPQIMLASGTKDSVREAMMAAVKMAERFSALEQRKPRPQQSAVAEP